MLVNIVPGSKWEANESKGIVIVIVITNTHVFYSDLNGLYSNLPADKFLQQHKLIINQQLTTPKSS